MALTVAAAHEWPAGQTLHAGAPKVFAKRPGAQSEHCDAAAAAYRPGAHSMATPAAAPHLWPSGQSTQSSDATVFASRPAAQSLHAVAPSYADVPSGHSSHCGAGLCHFTAVELVAGSASHIANVLPLPPMPFVRA